MILKPCVNKIMEEQNSERKDGTARLIRFSWVKQELLNHEKH